VRILTDIDHRQISDEAAANPAFGRKLAAMIERPNGLKLIDESAARAVLNELDGRSFPESRGEWPVLRKRFNILIRDVARDIQKSVDALTLDEKADILNAYAKGGVQVVVRPLGEYPVESLGQWEAIVGAIAGAASSIYGARVQSSTQKEIAKIQAATEARSLEAQMTLAKAQMALQAAQVQQINQQTAAITAGTAPAGTAPTGTAAKFATSSSMASALTKDVGGLPLWAIPAGIGVVGSIIYAVVKG
jgi:hypothetical protein